MLDSRSGPPIIGGPRARLPSNPESPIMIDGLRSRRPPPVFVRGLPGRGGCRLGVALLAAVAAVASPASEPAPDRAADPSQAKVQAAVARVFDTSVLHRIEIVIAKADVSKIARRTDERIRCTFTFDGKVIEDVGIRQAGGPYHPFLPLSGKPSFSIKFNEFVKGQDLFGLEKLVLKNGLQDLSYVNEHMTYEVFRRAGLPAPFTAHAAVTINGADAGLYVMREPVNKQFLTRNFGKQYSEGPLYEMNLPGLRDLADNPEDVELKNEEDGRNRAYLRRLAAILTKAPKQTFAEIIPTAIDLDVYITFFAVEAATSDFDGFSFHNNNSYFYEHPKDHLFRFIPYGADEAFWATGTPVTQLSSPFQQPRALLARRIQEIPEFMARFKAEVARVGKEPIWDKAALRERVAQVDRIFSEYTAAHKSGRTTSDIRRFYSYRRTIERFIDAGGTTNGTRGLP